MAELGEVKVLESKGGWKDVEAPTPDASGIETVVTRKATRKYRLETDPVGVLFLLLVPDLEV